VPSPHAFLFQESSAFLLAVERFLAAAAA
jgi:hypothetical protein